MTASPAPPTADPAPASAVASADPTDATAALPGASTADVDGDIHPGTYHTEGFEPRNFSFTIREPEPGDQGWTGDMTASEIAAANTRHGVRQDRFTGQTRWALVAETAGQLYFEFIRRVDPERELSSWAVLLPNRFRLQGSPAEVIAELAARRNYEAGEPSETEFGGVPAVAVDGVASPQASFFPTSINLTWPEDTHVRFIAYEVGDETKLAVIFAPLDEWDAFAPDAEELLATFAFAP